ncbi:MAG: hypothetical protein ACK5RG_22115 [Cyclobacteriaceae bacterium]|jgi:hypothetical protein|nr:hypothetical protein [Flammeovirgaceae bacterium]
MLKKIICLCSDLDCVINPLNQFRTATDYQQLSDGLLLQVQDYWSSSSRQNTERPLKPRRKRHSVSDYSNALHFIREYYR